MGPFKSIFNFCSIHSFSILFGLFLLQVSFFWPGELTSDSSCQYAMAISGNYSDHHPFIMSYLWHFLDKVYAGPGLMLFFHLSLFYASLFYLMKAAPQKKYFFLFIPFIPQILIFSFIIWKDVGFAFSFLFVGSYLTYKTCYPEKTSPSLFKMFPILIILSYGTLVKFQAQYLAPIMLLWMGYTLNKNRFGQKFIFNSFVVGLLFYGILTCIKVLSPSVKEDHSWQYVKLYDMAAISHETGEDIFPFYAKTAKFKMETLHKNVSHQRVDDLVFGEEAILTKSSNPSEREDLWRVWAKTFLDHPYFYLKHRTMNLGYALCGVPNFDRILDNLDRCLEENSLSYKLVYWISRLIGFLFLAYFIPVILSFVYMVLGFLAWKKSIYAAPLFFLNLTGCTLITVLFFCSMAGTPRYLYLISCLVGTSSYFAYKCWKSLRT